MLDIPLTLTVEEAHRRYEAIRPRLPEIGRTGPARLAARLLETAEHYDGYLFDAFGVLNVGETAIPGAAACLAALRAIGKRFCILTNAASYTSAVALAKYHALGLDVRAGEVVSSRDVLFAHLGQTEPGLHWAAICAAGGPERVPEAWAHFCWLPVDYPQAVTISEQLDQLRREDPVQAIQLQRLWLEQATIHYRMAVILAEAGR